MTKYKAKVNGEEIEVIINFSTAANSFALEADQVSIAQLAVIDGSNDDVSILPLSRDEDRIEMYKQVRGKKPSETLLQRDDNESPMRCFVFKTDYPVQTQGIFNIGASQITVKYEGEDIKPNESFCTKNEDFSPAACTAVIFAATCYYDLVRKVNPNLYSKWLIQTTKDEDTAKVLEATGLWKKVTSEHPLFESFANIEPEVDDGRGGRFKASDDGSALQERCIIEGRNYGYENKYVLVHESNPDLLGAILTAVDAF